MGSPGRGFHPAAGLFGVYCHLEVKMNSCLLLLRVLKEIVVHQ